MYNDRWEEGDEAQQKSLYETIVKYLYETVTGKFRPDPSKIEFYKNTLSEEGKKSSSSKKGKTTPGGGGGGGLTEQEKLFNRRIQKISSGTELKKFYEKQIRYVIANFGNCCTFIINFAHFRVYKRVISEYLESEYLRVYDVVRKSVFFFLSKVVGKYGELKEPILEDKIFVGFCDVSAIPKVLRSLKSETVGKLVSVSGTVTRTGEVRPELIVGKFICQKCATRSNCVKQRFVYTVPTKCSNRECPGGGFKLLLDDDETEFVNFQKIRIQENTSEIPSGTIPRTMDIIVRNDQVEIPKSGDRIVFVGSMIVLPDTSKIVKVGGPKKGETDEEKRRKQEASNKHGGTVNEGVKGLKVLGIKEMTYRLAFVSHYCSSMVFSKFNIYENLFTQMELEKKNFLDSLSHDELLKIQQMKSDSRILNNLVNSICPQIYGYEEIKKGILLQMVGGVHKVTKDAKINLRGDINICVVGDPGTAKSQFLKYVANTLPRAVYTSGKASSSAGLTASVVKKKDTGEFHIEAGALMLADNGICCIDEFDKMDSQDQVAIHEAMEQQTISIAKAGIRATLHARTAILAAANPVGGKYNRSKTLRANIGHTLSAPLISRFDLFFVICDKYDEETDTKIAKHILKVHRGDLFDEIDNDPKRILYGPKEIQLFIKYVQTQYNPILTKEAKELLKASYVSLRQRDKVKNQSFRISVRQLESLVRISEAIARIYGDNHVRKRHSQEAILLLQKTIMSVDLPNVDLEVPKDSSAYMKTLRKEDKKKRRELLNRIRSNVGEFKQVYENDRFELQKAEDQLEGLQRKRKKLIQIKNAIESEIRGGDLDDVKRKLRLKEIALEKLEENIEKMKEKLEASKSNYQREKSEEEKLLESLDEDMKKEIEDEESSQPTKKKEKKSKKPKPKFSLSHESYKSLTNFLVAKLKEREKNNESGLTVRKLIEHCITEEQDNAINFVGSTKKFQKLMKGLIVRLINVDNILIDLNLSEKKKLNKHKIILNPNFSD